MSCTLPTYTHIPNFLFDDWLHVLTHVEFKILMCIAYHSFCVPPKEEKLSINRITKLTDGKRETVRCCVLSLKKQNLVVQNERGLQINLKLEAHQ